VANGDTLLFSWANNNSMTVIGNSAIGDRWNTLFLGRPADSVVISRPAAGTQSLAGLTIGAGNYARAAINLPNNAPGGQNPSIAGDFWYNGSNLYFNNGTTTLNLGLTWNFLPSGSTGLDNLFSGKFVGNATMGGTTTQGSNNALFGENVGTNITTGQYNAVFGIGSGTALTTGYRNAIIGSYTGYQITTGYSNVLAGTYAGAAITSGANNTCIGDAAGTAIVAGAGNTLLGQNSGAGVTSGTTNVCVGYNSGGGITSGGGNTVIGASLGSLSNPSNTLILGAGGVQLVVADSTTVRPQKPIRLPSYTVSGLPSASTAGAGSRAWVTDATVSYSGTNLGTTASGGGSFGAPVISNGTNWIIG
jgi:hypothetical protein